MRFCFSRVKNMDDLDCLGKIPIPIENVNSQILINIIEGKDYYKNNVNTYVRVEIPPHFNDKTKTRKKTRSPSYFKKFIVDLPSMSLKALLSLNVIITVFESKKVLGNFVIELFTIWSEPDKMFRNKWLTLIDRKTNNMSVKGYLKCDLFMFCDVNPNVKLMSNPVDFTFDEFQIRNNLLIPNGFKLASSHLAKYSLKLYRGEMTRSCYNSGVKKLSIDFGEASEPSIVLDIKKTDLNWYQEYSTVQLYPPLCPTIVFKLFGSKKTLVSYRSLSMYDYVEKDGLSRFGPAFVHFSSSENQIYFGRILISVETKLVPPGVENIENLQNDRTITLIPDNELIYIKVVILGLIFRVDQVHEILMKSKSMSISMEYGEYSYASAASENEMEIRNLQTPEYEGAMVEDNYYKLSVGHEDKKSCLFLVVNLPSVEYYAMFAMNLYTTTVDNMVTCVSETAKHLGSQRSKTSNRKKKIVRDMFGEIFAHYRRFSRFYDEDINLQKHVHTSWVNFMKSFHDICLEEYKKMSTSMYIESDILILMGNIKDALEQLTRNKTDSYNGPPNIFLNLCDGTNVVSRCQIEARHFLHSDIPEFKGKFCGKIRPWFLVTEKSDNLFDGIIENVFWMGPYINFSNYLNQIPGRLFYNCDDQPCLLYRCNIHDKTMVRFNAHISQVTLTEKCYMKYGRLNVMVRVIFNGHSMTTKVIYSNVSPSLDVSISSEPMVLVRYGDANQVSSTHAIVQLCDIRTKKKESIESIIGFAVVRPKEIASESRATLDWFDVVDGYEKIAKIFLAVEIVRTSDEPTEADGGSQVPLLNHVQPKHSVYRLIVLFWGLRQCESQLLSASSGIMPFARMVCSGVNVDSDVIKNVKSSPNFPNVSNKRYKLDVQLPEDSNLIPPICFHLFAKFKRNKEPISVGVSAPRPIEQFLVPVTPKSERQAFHTVLEINRNDVETYETNGGVKNKMFSNIGLTSIFYSKKFISIVTKPISMINTFISTNYTMINDEHEEDENEFNWWTKYYGFKHQKNTNKRVSKCLNNPCKHRPFCKGCEEPNRIYLEKLYANIKTTTIYDTELENVPEFNRFEDNIKTFEIYGFNENKKQSKTIAIFKGNVRVYQKSNDDSDDMDAENQIWPTLKSNEKCVVVVRVYILRANNLRPRDIGGFSDPYVEVQFGKCYRVSDHKNYVPKTLNPMFGRCFQKEMSLPECSMLKVKIKDYDMIGKNELIGETLIDIESRYYSKHRATCGLAKQYDRVGYNRWRDSAKPSTILHDLCVSHSLKPPTYTENSVQVGSKTFVVNNKNTAETPNRIEQFALYVLNHWHEMPAIGCRLVPEHVETRTLHNRETPYLHQGTLEMWVDVFPKNGNIPEIVDVTPPIAEHYELRVIILSVVDVKLVDNNFFTGEHSDILIQGWLPDTEEKQYTDVHRESLNGVGLFNWRFKFPLLYKKAENVIVRKSKDVFSLDFEEQHFSPKLHLQVLDSNRFSSDLFIGSLVLDLWNMPKGASSSRKCTTSDTVRKINLFKEKKTRGWWPFVSAENNKNTIVGKLNAEIQILTKKEADKSAAGYGRESPQALPEPTRLSTGYLAKTMGALAPLMCHCFKTNKSKLCCVVVIALLTLFVIAIPGYLAKKLMRA